MNNPTMILSGYDFLAASRDDSVGSGVILQGPEFRGTEDGFQINIGEVERPEWVDCHEPVGIPANVKLNFSVLDGNGAYAK